VIRLEQVSKCFRQGQNEVQALDRVSLHIPHGEFLSVMGPSGSGKSTMLHLIGGLDTPSAGEIFVADAPLSKMSDDEITLFRRRKIGFVFQFFNLLPTLSAEENVALPLLLDGKRMKDIGDRVGALLELVGLAHRRKHRPDAMSGGEMQRVAVARALAIEPVLLLADEPTGNLDTKTGEGILELIKQANTQQGQTVILVTHDTRAAGYADRTITLKDGRIVGAGA
jgi:putative ABC transport system ATP-binding protein